MTALCALCGGVHGPAYPLAEAALCPRTGAFLAAGTAVCVRCTCCLREPDRSHTRAADAALERN